jgi:protein-S-isoprenylcysteine O-methyltransferase Ste14
MVAPEPSRIPDLGARGGGWVAAQVVLIAGIGVSAVVGLGWPHAGRVPAYAVGAFLIAVGLLLLVVGGIQLGSALTPFPAPRTGGGLVAGGLYRRARHPMYGGGILIAAGWSILFGSVVGGILTVGLALLFELKSRREEAWLVDHYAGYPEYRDRTRRRFLPFVW